MIKYKCETCNFEFEVSFDDDVAICPICGNEQKGFYELAKKMNPKEYWKNVIAKYNAEYEGNAVKINTYRRKCIYEDEDYIKAIELSSGELKEKYLKEAKEISSQEKELYKKDILIIINNFIKKVEDDEGKTYNIYREKIHYDEDTDKKTLIHWEFGKGTKLKNEEVEEKEILEIHSLKYVIGNIYRSGYVYNKCEATSVELNDYFQDIHIYIKTIWNKIYEIEYDLDGGKYKNKEYIWDSEYTEFSDVNDVHLPKWNIFRGKELFIGWYDENDNLVDDNNLEYRDYRLKAKYAQYIHEKYYSEILEEEVEYFEFGVVENERKEIESIRWDIVEKKGNEYTLVTRDVNDHYFRNNFYFFNSQKKRFHSLKFINPNSYEFSNIRALLNSYDGTSYGVYNYTEGGFLNSVFSEEGKKLIKSVPLEVLLRNEKPSNKKGLTTEDKVYILSEEDLDKYEYNDTMLRDIEGSKYVKVYKRGEIIQELVDNTNQYKDSYIMIRVILD